MKMLPAKKSPIIYVLPWLLLLSTWVAFHFFVQWFGQKAGYFAGFLFYWCFWCLAIPFMLVGKKSLAALFHVSQPALGKHQVRNLLLLVLPLILVYGYEFPRALQQANTLILLASAGISVVNATVEEILWRGTFLTMMREKSKAYVPFSSFGFAIWHLAPLSVSGNHHPGGALSFVSGSFSPISATYNNIPLSTKKYPRCLSF